MGMHIIACTSTPKTTPASRRLHSSFPSCPSSSSHATHATHANAMGDDEGLLPLEWHAGGTTAQLHKFLGADLDILAVFTPLTAATRHALGRAEFDILARRAQTPAAATTTRSRPAAPPAPFLVNVSRGPIIVQDALVAALKDGRLAGAALDVTDPEPLPATHELWQLPNVSITPHMSWCFEDYVEDCVQTVLAENVARLDKGVRLVNQI
ncbi:D-isomer specific 2-hydroxyacid dehydrogenase [Coniella lustricola]|uniref:D-isomer specific 2-hydroxyacid dehydrogenase n=1 Tax=Coniella lustricola TaxID=2025994 RepID=A0A2T2ZYE4_9PEZI|nr:D-isomer specific 2-hydroxyacid dehydrogenase [Coniella lustricola]